MMSLEEAQDLGKKRIEEEQALYNRRVQIRNEELKKMGVNPNAQLNPSEKYEHPSMPGSGMMAVLFIIGYVVCFMFKPWWLGFIVMTILLGKYVSRHDND